jgi:hypothetical protein
MLTPAAAQQPPGVPQAPQPAAPPQAPQQVVVYQNPSTDANDTRQQLEELLRQYPPTLRQVLQADPTLISRPDYLAPYPQLVAFLQQHPDVVRNPSFFFGRPFFEEQQTDRQRSLRFIQETLGAVAFLTGFIVALSFIYSLLRQVLDHRRWRRQVQLQTEVHTKLFDRLTTNQEMLAYLDTAAGRRFLESGPPVSSEGAPTLAPITRILWSVQIGMVVAAVGIGFLVARTTVADVEISSAFEVMGTLAIAVGVGFVISAIVSWLLSVRFGLLRSSKAES